MAGVLLACWMDCNGNYGMQPDFGSLGMAEDVELCLPAYLQFLAKEVMEILLCESGHY